MITVNWPEGFPALLLDSSSIVRGSVTTGTQMANGYTRMRRIFENVPSMINGAIILNNQQAIEFERWYNKDLKMVNNAMMPIRQPGERVPVLRKVKFTNMYTMRSLGKEYWRFSFKLEGML